MLRVLLIHGSSSSSTKPACPHLSFAVLQSYTVSSSHPPINARVPLGAKDPWTLNRLIPSAYIMSTGINEVIASHTNADDQNNVGTVTLPTTAETATQIMARTLQTARMSTGGKAPRMASKRTKQTARKSTAGKSSTSTSSGGDGDIVVTSVELIPKVPRRRKPPIPPKPVTPGLRRSTRLRQRSGEVLPESGNYVASTYNTFSHGYLVAT